MRLFRQPETPREQLMEAKFNRLESACLGCLIVLDMLVATHQEIDATQKTRLSNVLKELRESLE